jgi:hypothetical protein
MELFGDCAKTETLTRMGRASEPWERSDGEASATLAVDSSDRGLPDQDRHTSAVKRAPVQTIGLARPIPPFDFAAAIRDDPRAEPMPDVPVPEWLRLPGVDP